MAPLSVASVATLCHGFKILADDYLKDPVVRPHPLRVGHLLIASAFLISDESVRSLSYLSLVFFICSIITAFFFVQKYWDTKAALLLGILLCFSPLASGMARRALMDTEHSFFILLTLFAFITFVRQVSIKNLSFLILALFTSIITKELTLFYYPLFIGGFLILKKNYNPLIEFKHIVLSATVPTLLAAVVYISFFGGISPVVDIIKLFGERNILQPFPYKTNFLSGPWYQYFIDYFVLSPVISILFFLFIGHFLNQPNKHFVVKIFLIFFIYSIFVYSFLIKDVRYVLIFDVIYRLFAGLMLLDLTKKLKHNTEIRKLTLAVSVILIVLLDIRKFDNIFIQNKVYDPVAFNLLTAESFFIPPYQKAVNGDEANELNKHARLVLENPTAENYQNLSLAYYQNRSFQKCIRAAGEAIKLRPDYAEAYNNICSAYNELQQWDTGIKYCEKALEIRPDFELAENNLRWALSKKSSAAKSEN